MATKASHMPFGQSLAATATAGVARSIRRNDRTSTNARARQYAVAAAVPHGAPAARQRSIPYPSGLLATVKVRFSAWAGAARRDAARVAATMIRMNALTRTQCRQRAKTRPEALKSNEIPRNALVGRPAKPLTNQPPLPIVPAHDRPFHELGHLPGDYRLATIAGRGRLFTSRDRTPRQHRQDRPCI